MSGSYLFLGLFAAILILIMSFVDLLLLIVKKRLPVKRGFEKEWKARGLVPNEQNKRPSMAEKSSYQSKDIIMIIIVGISIFFIGYVFFQNLFFALMFSCLASSIQSCSESEWLKEER